MELSNIDKKLYQCGWKAQGIPASIHAFDVVVDLSGVQHLPLPGMLVISMPFDDDTKLPDTLKLEMVAKLLHYCVYIQGLRVMVHCDAGLSRSGLICGRIVSLEHPEWTGDQVITFIRQRRKSVGPALMNNTFCDYLRRKAGTHEKSASIG